MRQSTLWTWPCIAVDVYYEITTINSTWLLESTTDGEGSVFCIFGLIYPPLGAVAWLEAGRNGNGNGVGWARSLFRSVPVYILCDEVGVAGAFTVFVHVIIYVISSLPGRVHVSRDFATITVRWGQWACCWARSLFLCPRACKRLREFLYTIEVIRLTLSIAMWVTCTGEMTFLRCACIYVIVIVHVWKSRCWEHNITNDRCTGVRDCDRARMRSENRCWERYLITNDRCTGRIVYVTVHVRNLCATSQMTGARGESSNAMPCTCEIRESAMGGPVYAGSNVACDVLGRVNL